MYKVVFKINVTRYIDGDLASQYWEWNDRDVLFRLISERTGSKIKEIEMINEKNIEVIFDCFQSYKEFINHNDYIKIINSLNLHGITIDYIH